MTLYEYLKQGISKETELYAYYQKHTDDIKALEEEYQSKLSELKGQIMEEFMKDKGLEREKHTDDDFYDYIQGLENKFIETAKDGVDYDKMKKIYIRHILENNL